MVFEGSFRCLGYGPRWLIYAVRSGFSTRFSVRKIAHRRSAPYHHAEPTVFIP